MSIKNRYWNKRYIPYIYNKEVYIDVHEREKMKRDAIMRPALSPLTYAPSEVKQSRTQVE